MLLQLSSLRQLIRNNMFIFILSAESIFKCKKKNVAYINSATIPVYSFWELDTGKQAKYRSLFGKSFQSVFCN